MTNKQFSLEKSNANTGTDGITKTKHELFDIFLGKFSATKPSNKPLENSCVPIGPLALLKNTSKPTSQLSQHNCEACGQPLP